MKTKIDELRKEYRKSSPYNAYPPRSSIITLLDIIEKQHKALDFYGDMNKWYVNEFGDSVMNSYIYDDEEDVNRDIEGEGYKGGLKAREVIKETTEMLEGVEL